MSAFHCPDCGYPRADCYCEPVRDPVDEIQAMADLENDSYPGRYGNYTQREVAPGVYQLVRKVS